MLEGTFSCALRPSGGRQTHSARTSLLASQRSLSLKLRARLWLPADWREAGSGGRGGGAWVGPAHSKKEGRDARLFPPPTALWEHHGAPTRQSHGNTPIVPVLRRAVNPHALALFDPRTIRRFPARNLPRGQVVRDAARLVITEIRDFRTTPRLSRGLPFYPLTVGGEYSPFTFSVPRFKRTSTGAPPSSAFCRRRRYCKPMFFEAL
mgnify:CR=1 FL=1